MITIGILVLATIIAVPLSSSTVQYVAALSNIPHKQWLQFRVLYTIVLALGVAILLATGYYFLSRPKAFELINSDNVLVKATVPMISQTLHATPNASTSVAINVHATPDVLTQAANNTFGTASAVAKSTTAALATLNADATISASVKATVDALATIDASASETVDAKVTSVASERATIDAHSTTNAKITATIIARSTVNAQVASTANAKSTSELIAQALHTARASVATIVAARATPTAISKPPRVTTPEQPSVKLTFHTLSLISVANARTQEGYVDPPLNDVWLGGIKFHLPPGKNSVTTQAETLSSFPTKITLSDLDVSLAKSAYFLITGGNTKLKYKGNKVGEVRLYFEENRPYIVDLIAGQNIREWKLYGNRNVTSTLDRNVSEIWRGENTHDDGKGIIDMLTVDLPVAYHNDTLIKIELVDLSINAGSMDPAINLIGITVLGK